jgi:hypothetical protein
MAVDIKNLKAGDTFTAKEEVDRYRTILYAARQETSTQYI